MSNNNVHFQKLIAVYEQNPETRSIDLSSKQIENLEEYLQILEAFTQLSSLALNDNSIEVLPQDLSRLYYLENLDLRGNPIDIAKSIAGLQSLKSLRVLLVDVPSQQAENFLHNKLHPNIQIITDSQDSLPEFNGINERQENQSPPHFNQSVGANSSQQQQQQQHESQRQQQQFIQQNPSEHEITLKQDDLKQIAATFDLVRELYNVNSPGQDEALAEEFDSHVKNVMQNLSEKLEKKFPDNILNAQIVKAKYSLYEICFAKIIDFLATIDPNIAQVLQTIHDTHATIFKDLSQIIVSSPTQKFKQEYAPHYNELKEENEQLKQQLKDLEEENKRYLDQIIKHSKGINSSNYSSIQQSSQQQQQQPNNNNTNSHHNESSQFSKYESKFAAPQFAANSNSSVVAAGSTMVPATVRTLTIRQLKEVIDEIYKSKQTFDKKYLEAQLPRETMEQHMYTYLNQKYGLKNIIIEWATSIINGIRKHSADDNDVAVFGKILRNECDEEFRFVQNQVKNTIQELLKMYLRGRYPYKHTSEIKDMVQSKMNGWIYEEEAVDIIKYMYNAEDSETLCSKMQQHYTYSRQSTALQESLTKKKISREQFSVMSQEKEKPKIEYLVFQKIILDFQLKSHETFLKRFIQLFRTEDQDLNGVVDESEFRILLNKMDVQLEEQEIQRFLTSVDPYNKQSITFSQCVTLFSSEVISDSNGQQLSILQKIQSLE